MRKKINLTALIMALCLSIPYIPASVQTVFAAAERTDLTVEQAVKKAVGNSTAIKNANDSEGLSDENIRKAYDSLFNTSTNAEYVNAEANLMTLEMNRAYNLESIDAQKENIEYNIKKYFNSIINAEKNAELFEASLELEKRKLDISKVKYDLGKMSQADYDKEVASYEMNLSAVQTNANAIDKAYRVLNDYMGEDLNKKYNLILELDYEPIGEIKLTPYIDTFINNSLSVKQDENNLKTAEYKYDNYSISYNTDTGVISESYNEYEQLLVNVNQAARTLSDTKESIRKNIIDTYEGLKDSEISIDSKMSDLESAYAQLSILETKLELGKATQIEIDEQRHSIAEKEESLRQAKNSYALNVIAFSSPNLLTSMNA